MDQVVEQKVSDEGVEGKRADGHDTAVARVGCIV